MDYYSTTDYEVIKNLNKSIYNVFIFAVSILDFAIFLVFHD